MDLPSNPVKPEPSFTTLVNVANRTAINGREYGILHLVESHPQLSLLRGNTQDYFQGNLQLFMHELGHTMGLGVPEWYFLDTSDRTGVLPNLGPYNFREANRYDPMAQGSDGPFRFADMNAAIINSNLEHQRDFEYFQRYAASRVKVIVANAQGARVPGARIRVYGARQADFYRRSNAAVQPLIEEKTADASGEVYIAPPSTNWAMTEAGLEGYNILIVKAAMGDAAGGVYVTTNDIQRTKVLDASDTFVANVVLRASSSTTESADVHSFLSSIIGKAAAERVVVATYIAPVLGSVTPDVSTKLVAYIKYGYGLNASVNARGGEREVAGIINDLTDVVGKDKVLEAVQNDKFFAVANAALNGEGIKTTKVVRDIDYGAAFDLEKKLLPAFWVLTGINPSEIAAAKGTARYENFWEGFSRAVYAVRLAKRDLAMERKAIRFVQQRMATVNRALAKQKVKTITTKSPIFWNFVRAIITIDQTNVKNLF